MEKIPLPRREGLGEGLKTVARAPALLCNSGRQSLPLPLPRREGDKSHPTTRNFSIAQDVQEEFSMTRFAARLQEMAALGRTQGYLTYDQVNAFLPDESTD